MNSGFANPIGLAVDIFGMCGLLIMEVAKLE